MTTSEKTSTRRTRCKGRSTDSVTQLPHVLRPSVPPSVESSARIAHATPLNSDTFATNERRRRRKGRRRILESKGRA